VGRILNEADIKPHRSKYWEFTNIEELVKLIAEKPDIKDELGVKEKCGILKNLESRKLFLSDLNPLMSLKKE
jgi:hypothetical protein